MMLTKKLCKTIRYAKRKYFLDYLNLHTNNIKKLWEGMRRLMGNRRHVDFLNIMKQLVIKWKFRRSLMNNSPQSRFAIPKAVALRVYYEMKALVS